MPFLPEKRSTGMRKRLFCTALSILVEGCCLSGTSMAQDSTPILDRGEGAWSSS
ncbi:sorbosone dehydrogenase family protein, partial [Sinorhizobium medicae]|nr:sorbosone dehydrogenase family protein [Sinorhizobium medicae]